MSQITNFLLMSQVNTSSTFVKGADLLLTPARALFGGKQVIVFYDNTMDVVDQQLGPISSNPLVKVAFKVIVAIILPFAFVLGVLVKLISLKDKSCRAFCAQEIPQNSTCHPKLLEMFQHVHSTADFLEKDRWNSEKLVFKPLDLYEDSGSRWNRELHRLLSPLRNNKENAVVQRLIKERLDKSQLIDLVSVAAVGLMSEFLILEKLVLAGFENIAIDCVHPLGSYTAQIEFPKLEKIRQFFANYPKASIKIQVYEYTTYLPKTITDYSECLAIDNTYDDLIKPSGYWGEEKSQILQATSSNLIE